MGRQGYCAKYIQLIQLEWAERACTCPILEYSVLARLSAHNDWISCTVCTRRNIIVFHFAGLSIYNLLIYIWFTGRYNTIKGDMVAVEGEEWRLVEPLSTTSWTAPRPVAPQWEADVRSAQKKTTLSVSLIILSPADKDLY